MSRYNTIYSYMLLQEHDYCLLLNIRTGRDCIRLGEELAVVHNLYPILPLNKQLAREKASSCHAKVSVTSELLFRYWNSGSRGCCREIKEEAVDVQGWKEIRPWVSVKENESRFEAVKRKISSEDDIEGHSFSVPKKPNVGNLTAIDVVPNVSRGHEPSPNVGQSSVAVIHSHDSDHCPVFRLRYSFMGSSVTWCLQVIVEPHFLGRSENKTPLMEFGGFPCTLDAGYGGLIGGDQEWVSALEEAVVHASSEELVQILIFCDVCDIIPNDIHNHFIL
ncbi:hypothetical protein Tco_1353208 [Tanacetum coccineum]